MKRICTLFATVFFGVVGTHAAVLHGTVKNGTTGKTVSGVEVILLQLQGGMQPVGNSKTDAQGQFTFDNPSVGAQPMLVRAVYKGINFHTPLPPGRSDIEVAVFEPSKDPKTIAVGSRIVFFAGLFCLRLGLLNIVRRDQRGIAVPLGSVLPDSVSRFSRCRSVRTSAACW